MKISLKIITSLVFSTMLLACQKSQSNDCVDCQIPRSVDVSFNEDLKLSGFLGIGVAQLANPSFKTFHLAIPVQNNSKAILCQLQAEVKFYNRVNDLGAAKSGAGSFMTSSDGTVANFCLAPDETGYFVFASTEGLKDLQLQNANSVNIIDLTWKSEQPLLKPVLSFVSLEKTASTEGDFYNYLFNNESASDINLNSITMVNFDESGTFTSWTRLLPLAGSELHLDAQGTLEVERPISNGLMIGRSLVYFNANN